MKARIRFSVITPTFNRANLLPRCIESLQAQRFGEFELIIVDDGSTDSTTEVVNDFRQGDARIRYFSQQNQGANAARNLGCREAKGEYFLFLDSDDSAKPSWLAAMAALITETNNPATACCGIDFFDAAGVLRSSKTPPNDREGSTSGGVFNSGTYAIRRDVFADLGGFSESLPAHQSSELKLRLFELCRDRSENIVSIGENLVAAYQHHGENIRSDARAKLEATKMILTNHREKFMNKRSIASWLTSAGGCAAELREYGEARRHFFEAIRTYPRNWKNYIRLVLCSTPLVRRLFWRNTGVTRE